jgi:hypothetical protein
MLGFEHPQSLVSIGDLEAIPHRYLGMTIIACPKIYPQLITLVIHVFDWSEFTCLSPQEITSIMNPKLDFSVLLNLVSGVPKAYSQCVYPKLYQLTDLEITCCCMSSVE